MNQLIIKIIESWINREGNVNTIDDILKRIDYLNKTTEVRITEKSIDESTFWFYDELNGEIMNQKRCFFSIKGLQRIENNELAEEQPIIKQPEIGYLGIICKEINGVINFLMQLKIEPGNINCIQISPTIQATKSNFTRCHGGKYPPYLSYFENLNNHSVIVDQIQSEQSSRFYKKRNRNIIILVSEEVEVLPSFVWMTLGQLKELMKLNNMVNMDTRSVLSGIPLAPLKFTAQQLKYLSGHFADESFYKSVFHGKLNESLIEIYNYINTYKMLHDDKKILVPLNQLSSWKVTNEEVTCKYPANFMIKFYDIYIEGREVQNWQQPLLKSLGMATFGLITCIKKGKRQFLVRATPEIGVFDKIELGPTVMLETNSNNRNAIESFFDQKLRRTEAPMVDVILSEEGGRFYHEQNRNVILEVRVEELPDLPADYFLVDYYTLNHLVQINNCLNIQLRNLLSLLEV